MWVRNDIKLFFLCIRNDPKLMCVRNDKENYRWLLCGAPNLSGLVSPDFFMSKIRIIIF